MINAKIDDKKCVVTLKGIENNAKNMNRAMRIIALEMEESVRENFEVGGRYSSPGSLLGGNHKWVKGKYGGSLIKTGNLRDSITSKSGDDFAQVGTNIAYAKIHNFGATVAGKTIIPVFPGFKKSPYKMSFAASPILCGFASDLPLKKSEKFDEILTFGPNFWRLGAPEVAVDFVEFPVGHTEQADC